MLCSAYLTSSALNPNYRKRANHPGHGLLRQAAGRMRQGQSWLQSAQCGVHERGPRTRPTNTMSPGNVSRHLHCLAKGARSRSHPIHWTLHQHSIKHPTKLYKEHFVSNSMTTKPCATPFQRKKAFIFSNQPSNSGCQRTRSTTSTAQGIRFHWSVLYLPHNAAAPIKSGAECEDWVRLKHEGQRKWAGQQFRLWGGWAAAKGHWTYERDCRRGGNAGDERTYRVIP